MEEQPSFLAKCRPKGGAAKWALGSAASCLGLSLAQRFILSGKKFSCLALDHGYPPGYLCLAHSFPEDFPLGLACCTFFVSIDAVFLCTWSSDFCSHYPGRFEILAGNLAVQEKGL
jgi:hypothetical protein